MHTAAHGITLSPFLIIGCGLADDESGTKQIFCVVLIFGDPRRGVAMCIGLYKILFYFEALLHNNILCKHPLYCAIYCTILLLIAPPRPVLRYF